ncbi:hypothetical protein DY000_02022078 [Brassica cretica]|uniref:Uncharacterized protein n=1 Tax=Brassica cretica TaxID=69181 RepID=A0ABQ7E4X1_BRACR|nr:hypothetical protein DY000_02022078 [Brassica cretica]
MISVKGDSQFVTQHQDSNEVLQTSWVNLVDRQVDAVEKLYDELRDREPQMTLHRKRLMAASPFGQLLLGQPATRLALKGEGTHSPGVGARPFAEMNQSSSANGRAGSTTGFSSAVRRAGSATGFSSTVRQAGPFQFGERPSWINHEIQLGRSPSWISPVRRTAERDRPESILTSSS